MLAIEIVPFRDEFAAEFGRLNRDWLESHALLEDGDLPYLVEPGRTILEPGGAVFLALQGERVLGTIAVLRQPQRTFELAKLTVVQEARGHGLGRRLAETAIEFAIARGAERLVLSSNSRLVPAVRLYESLGFCHTTVAAGVAYHNADIHMELPLAPAAQRGQ
jgi:ribosomal protein S18 acetylase RimI-like enzyme